MTQADDVYQHEIDAGLISRGRGGFWVTKDGVLWPVPYYAEHYETLGRHGVPPNYQEAYNRGMVRIGFALRSIYVTFNSRASSEAIKTALRIVRHPGTLVNDEQGGTTYRRSWYIELERGAGELKGEAAFHSFHTTPGGTDGQEEAVRILRRHYMTARRRELAEAIQAKKAAVPTQNTGE